MMPATTRALLRVLERERESFAAERKLLVEQICHLSGSPWTLPPRDPDPVVPEPDFRYAPTPEQFPD